MLLLRGSTFYLQKPKDIFVIVAIERLSIQEFLQRSEGQPVIDVRSPAEYLHAHIPGAISLPLFNDEERKVVGTTYKQKSREEAIKIGLDYFGPKMRKMVEEAGAIANKQQVKGKDGNCLFVYCWRGGMRSAAVAWLLDLYGFKVHTLAGGYKAFRNHVLRSFEQPYLFKILGGYTGSGKTEVLHQLERSGEPVVDLEGIACHKGSAFGSFKMPSPPSQEMFENLLSIKLEEAFQHAKKDKVPEPAIWLEDESQRIGNINIPAALWENMRKSRVVFLEIPFEERLAHLVEEYGDCATDKLIESTLRIAKRLGPLETKSAVQFLQEGNHTEAFRILLQYYDKRYSKGLHNREDLSTLLMKIQCETVTPENAFLLTKYQSA